MAEMCTCIDQAGRAWEHISGMVEVNLDVIIVAATQTIEFSRRSHKCPSNCASFVTEVKEPLLQIYAKLVDLLQRAVAVYTEATTPTCKKIAELYPYRSLYHLSREEAMQISTQRQRVFQTQRQGGRVECMPSTMTLGKHRLDAQQSQYLALDLVCRTSRNLACAMQQMGDGERAGIATIDTRVLELLARVTRLVEEVSVALGAWSRSGP